MLLRECDGRVIDVGLLNQLNVSFPTAGNTQGGGNNSIFMWLRLIQVNFSLTPF